MEMIATIRITPPIVPPTMAPTFFEDCVVGEDTAGIVVVGSGVTDILVGGIVLLVGTRVSASVGTKILKILVKFLKWNNILVSADRWFWRR